MNGILSIELNGKTYRCRFNNFSNSVLEKYFMPEGKIALSGDELNAIIIKKWEENSVLLIRNLVYAGIVGDSLIENDEPALTKKEVGEFIANAHPDELFAIWQEFLDSTGSNLEADKEAEEKSQGKSDVKKKPTKKT